MQLIKNLVRSNPFPKIENTLHSYKKEYIQYIRQHLKWHELNILEDIKAILYVNFVACLTSILNRIKAHSGTLAKIDLFLHAHL
jgi:hypothetical protein